MLPVSISADLICDGVQVGCTDFSSAAEPAECGLDIEVPVNSANAGPL